MNTTPSRVRIVAALVLGLLAGLLAGGCGKSNKATAPRGDDAGEHLLVFCTTRVSGTAGEYDVVLYDADLAGYRSLAGLNASYGQSSPCLSDDGGFVCFASTRPTGAGGSDVYLYKRSSQELLATPGLNTFVDETWPRFTHDSVRMAFVVDSLGLKRVRLYEPYGDTLIRLPGLSSVGPYNDDAPAPDLHGNRIAFQTDRDGAYHVKVWDRATGILVAPGLEGDGADAEPSLSSNGRWLAFATTRSTGAGGYDIALYDLANNRLVPLPGANTAGDERHPAVSADGTVIFFASRPDASQNWSIWRYTLADSVRTQPPALASAAGDDRQPYLRWR